MKKRKHKLLLLDYNNLLFRALYSHQTLSFAGKFTGGIYGFVDMTASLVSKYDISRIVVCKDAKPYHRSALFDKYKAGRKALDEDTIKALNQSKSIVDEFLRLFRFTVLEEEGWEADDIIAHICRTRCKMYRSIYISSNDSDLFQLLYADNVYLCKKGGLYGRQDFEEEHGISPHQWPDVLALAGSHNGVAGVKGIGPKTAMKIVCAEDADAEIDEKMGKGIFDRNKRIATLPFPHSTKPPYTRPRPILYRERRFMKFLQKYGIQPTGTMLESFQSLSEE